jgi:hypothetical protein
MNNSAAHHLGWRAAMNLRDDPSLQEKLPNEQNEARRCSGR